MKRFFTRPCAVALGLCAALCSLPMTSMAADNWPAQPIKLVVPYAPGGLPDTVARILSQRLSTALGQSVVVDNRAGGGGAMAASLISQSPADGYTLMVTDGPLLSMAPLISKKPPFDATRDFAPVSLVGVAPLFLAVNANVPVKSFDELIALVKAKPGALNYGSAGLGTIHQLTAEAMKEGLGIDIAHVPYRGSGQSVPAMIGGQVDMIFGSPPALMGFVKSGQARVLAVNSAKRSVLLPDVPAISERLPGFDFAFTVAVLAKAGTPSKVVDRISNEIAKIVKIPAVIEQLQIAGVDPVGGSAAQLSEALRKESARMTAAARHANLQPE